MMTPCERLIERLRNVKQTGQGAWQALCPAHDDAKASLSVNEAEDGRVLLHCHAGCEPSAVVEAAGLKMQDLFPAGSGAANGKRTIREAYDYTDAQGNLAFQAVRYEPKDFRQRRPDGNGGWLYNVKGVPPVPYRLPRIVEAVRSGEALFVAEGEKDVHTLESIGLAATCNAGGAGKWKSSFSEYFKGASVAILPDNDEAGRKHAEDVAGKLCSVASSVKIVTLPGLKPKGDVSDWIDDRHTREKLLALVDAAPEWKPLMTPPGEAANSFPLTDLGNAERLIAAKGDNLRFDVNRGKWLVWNSVRWEHDETGEIRRAAASVIRSMHDDLKRLDGKARDELYMHIKKSESAPRLAAMVDLASIVRGVPLRAVDLDHDPWLLNCLNGTVDLRTGTLRPHTREDLMTKLAPVEYDPKAECPRWTRFLNEVFQGDPEVIGFVKRVVGYCLTGSTEEQSVFILTGKGSNGKSTLVEVLRVVLGDYAANTPFVTFVERRDTNTADLAALTGKRLVTASEGQDTQSFNESLLKELTGGDPVTCRHLFKEFFTYTPAFKIIFSTNEVPRIRSQNHAMKRRIKLVPFRQRFHDPEDGRTPAKDPRLLGKLLEERNGILTWAVEGCLEWRKNGLAVPAVVRQEVDRLFESQDPLAEFLESECEIGPGWEVEVEVMWAGFQQWCEGTKRKPPWKTSSHFSRNLLQRDGIESRRTGKVRYYTGITLRGDANDDKNDFPETSSMREEHEDLSENSVLPSLAVTAESETSASPPYSCGKCKADVPLQRSGAMYISRCRCGNPIKLAVNDYPKLRAFQVEDGASRQP